MRPQALILLVKGRSGTCGVGLHMLVSQAALWVDASESSECWGPEDTCKERVVLLLGLGLV